MNVTASAYVHKHAKDCAFMRKCVCDYVCYRRCLYSNAGMHMRVCVHIHGCMHIYAVVCTRERVYVST